MERCKICEFEILDGETLVAFDGGAAHRVCKLLAEGTSLMELQGDRSPLSDDEKRLELDRIFQQYKVSHPGKVNSFTKANAEVVHTSEPIVIPADMDIDSIDYSYTQYIAQLYGYELE